jgi:hypothetical protein
VLPRWDTSRSGTASTEDLTFFEAVLIAGVLVLPPTVAFATAVSGLVAA